MASPLAAVARLLLVDDEPDILETVQMLVEASLAGVQVLTADSGRRALTVLEQNPIDGVVTDFRMPGMDGADFANAVRQRWPQMPIMMLTAYVDEQTRAAIEERVPGLEVLPKPVDIEAFLPRVKRLLRKAVGGVDASQRLD